MTFINENTVEQATLDYFRALGYEILYGPDIGPGELHAERNDWGEVVLAGRLRSALERINPDIPADAIEDAIRKLLRTESPSLYENNHAFHKFLTNGVPVEFHADGRIKHDDVKLVDFKDTGNNDWLAVNQFTVIEDKRNRRPDVVVFVNGLPLAVIELKNPADEEATIEKAYNQLQTYKNDIPGLFHFNECLILSDGMEARAGTLTSNWEWFMPWRTVEGDDVAPKGSVELSVLINGMFEKSRFLDLVCNFNVFEVDGSSIVKKMAGYHQYHAVNKAIECTVKASSPKGDKRIGVVWHTQGSGKSLSMAFYAGKIIQHPAMENPTLVVITDRNDLDEQLHGTFCDCHELLRQEPVQAESRDHVRELLKVASGGVVFTTAQKFFPDEKGDPHPLLSDRRNIVVIADEAHRSQYGFIKGFAKHIREALPNASFIGFTGTPIESTDRSTPAVFGDYIDIYDIERAVLDGATVKIFYTGRLARIEIDEAERPHIDPDFEEVTESEEAEKKEKLKSKWSQLEKVVGTQKRINLIAEDIVNHFDDRLSVMDGKGMIVCMSRRICVDLYNAIIKLCPEWHDGDDKKGYIKVVITGSASDPADWQQHVRNKMRRKALAKRFKDEKDSMKLVIVCDMWLTGFDVPCLHTMYVDKPMRGHGLMQAIARVNRVFRDKPGGLVVDYIGLADQLKKAMHEYTESGGKGETTIDQEQVVAVLLEKYEIIKAMFHGFDYSVYFRAKETAQMQVMANAIQHILEIDEGKNRLISAVTDMSHAFALSVPHDKALAIRDEVGFFQAVKAAIMKRLVTGGTPQAKLDAAIRQIISKAVVSDEVVDIFDAVGLKKPDISILSDEFLEEVKHLPQKTLAVELLNRLLKDEVKSRRRKNVVQARSFTELLEKTILRYQNRTIETAKVIEELIGLAKDMREAHKRGGKLGLKEDELAFYDALEVNDSAVMELGDDVLKTIARELVQTIRDNWAIDWTMKENVRAKMRSMVKRLLRKYKYPPDKQEKATQTVLEQAELLCKDLAA
ncbi:MAG: type I restriction endonuclease subunit R [Planctomycetota bacterium]|nr:MAG: type I restriction endonuclease subunit R [Planctomycetota bacterium]